MIPWKVYAGHVTAELLVETTRAITQSVTRMYFFIGEQLILVSSSDLLSELPKDGFEFFLTGAAGEFPISLAVISMRRAKLSSKWFNAASRHVQESRCLALTRQE